MLKLLNYISFYRRNVAEIPIVKYFISISLLGTRRFVHHLTFDPLARYATSWFILAKQIPEITS